MRLGAVVIALVVVLAAGAWSAPIEEDDRAANDCGPIALYALLGLEGRPTSPDRIAAKLPPPRPGGYSMRELRDASRALGLRLDGVSLGKESAAIDRPMLAFLKVEKEGHFLVVRPVGHSGKLVQVIDSDRPPRVMERTDLVASDQWTGIVLAPARTWPSGFVAGIVAVSCFGLSALALARRRARGPRQALSTA